MRARPTFTALLAIGAAALTLTTVAPSAAAAPNTGSAGGSSGSACGPRSNADQLFLRESSFDKKDCDVQDAAIRLAQSECRWLDAHGNSAANRIELAEGTEDTLDYPFIFLAAAIQAYCPQYQD